MIQIHHLLEMIKFFDNVKGFNSECSGVPKNSFLLASSIHVGVSKIYQNVYTLDLSQLLLLILSMCQVFKA